LEVTTIENVHVLFTLHWLEKEYCAKVSTVNENYTKLLLNVLALGSLIFTSKKKGREILFSFFSTDEQQTAST
jgi:hypothetical protein